MMTKQPVDTFPHMLVLRNVPANVASSLEAALIGLALPNGNQIEKTFGVRVPTDRPPKVRSMHIVGKCRQRCDTRFRLLRFLDQRPVDKNLAKDCDLFFRQISGGVAFHNLAVTKGRVLTQIS